MKYELEKCLYLLTLLDYHIFLYYRYNLIKNELTEKINRQNIIDMALDNHDE